jgi:hypothetical protein
MWRRNKRRPDHHTIAHGRRAPRTPRRDVCRTVTWVCTQLERCGGALVAIDGRKCSAVTAPGRHGTTAHRAPLIAQMAARVEGSLPERAAADAPDEAGTPGGARAADLQTTIARRRERRRRDKDRQAAWEGRGHAQLVLPAPDRRALQGGAGGGPAVCEHVQTAVAATHHLRVAGEGTPEPTDRAGRRPRAVAAPAVLGGPFEVVAAVGSNPGQDVPPCLHVGLTPSSARPITAAQQPLGLFSTDAGTEEAAAATSGWPAGAGRSCRVATIALGRPLRDEATSAWRPGPLQAPCTRHQGGRRSTRWGDEPRREPRAARVHARPESMTPRQALVEPPLGPRKRRWTQGYVLAWRGQGARSVARDRLG